MAELQGTQTQQNLLKSFAGESQARNRYTYFAGIARKEGLRQISEIFEETANQESVHAKMMFKHLEGGDGLEITATYPAGRLGTTVENLTAAACGENEEWTELYPAFAETAKAEGFPKVAAMYTAIAVAEKQHEARYRKLIENLDAGKVFEKDGVVTWRCINCGYVHEAAKASQMCPACLHPQAHFEVLAANY